VLGAALVLRRVFKDSVSPKPTTSRA